ncbi:MAG: ferritin-like domain-containing protein [Verrucomicrobiota bacterium JB022]|nr:ferritin-like domain-containing protein [Verrucomicrobiota bacterium JB022]
MLNTLHDLYLEQLRDLYSAETQLIEALPKMEAAASNQDLKKAFREHLDETRNQADRLLKIFSQLNQRPDGHTCEAMKGLIREGEEAIRELGNPEVKDAALIAAANRVEHYEIAAYGATKTFGKILGEKEAVDLLEKSEKEESAADSKLTKLAEGGMFSKGLNEAAAKR